MTLRIKNTGNRCKMHTMSPQIGFAIETLRELASEDQVTVEVTSISDGVHGLKSWHYRGFAFDFTVPNDFTGQDGRQLGPYTRKVAGQLRTELGPDFDVVIEADHVHVEYDPKDGPR
jgi:hypothetical protein